jgi:type II secretory pathway component GspD/PulD (secretin)
MRMDVIIKDYLEPKKDYHQTFHKYMNKKASKIGEDILDLFNEYEADKYQKVLDKLNLMLKDEEKYNEKQWQTEILQIIRLIYPKYIAVFENVKIRDVYKPTNRYLDFMLIDANGNIDLVEIKKPFAKKGLVTKTVYRDNHVPVRELSGSIMQIEKYIFYLNKWGKTGEDELSKQYASQLPKDFNIKITNPGALIIMGRNDSMDKKQEEDFEIIKRKFKNVIDILTYDDLVNRLENTIKMFRKK